MAEIERRKAFYDELDTLKRLRVFLSCFTILFLLCVLYIHLARNKLRNTGEGRRKKESERNKESVEGS